jgi:multidrug efflux pump subunit AcrB
VIRFFAAHPTIANLLMIGFLAAGFYAVPQLQRETFPRVEPRRVQITITYPGARPEDVEEAICRRVEDAVDGVDNVTEIECEARENTAKAVVEMTEGGNLDRFFSDVKTEIDAIDDFPDEVEEPVVKQLGRTDFVASIAITGPQRRPDLKAYAEEVKERMLRWGGIPQVEITGFSDHQIRIELEDATLRQFRLSITDIADAIGRQSVDLPAGNIDTAEGQVLVRFADERKKVHEFMDLIVVSGSQGGQIRLGDIATITDRFDLDEEKILFNGRPAALLRVTKTENEDTLRVIDAIDSFVTHEKQTAPPGVDLVVTNDVSSIVRDRLNLLLTNGAQGLALVFLSMWLFFGLRYSFWIAVGLPVSFMGAMALMILFGYSINMLTMVGLLIVVGLLMDDAIVISENIATQRQKGKPRLDAAVDGTREVLPGVLSSFATTVCIFGSLAFLKGDIGAILKVIPVVMLCVLSVSLVEAFLILPNHLSHSLHQAKKSPSSVQEWVDRKVSWIRDNYVGRAVDATVKWRYLTFGCTIACLLVSVAAIAGGLLKFSAFPDLDGDTLEARILLPQGTPLSRTEAVVDQITAALARVDKTLTPAQPEGRVLVRNVIISFNKNEDAYENGTHVATVGADLLSADVRSTSSDEILALWREEIGDISDVIAIKFTEPAVGPAGRAIDLRLKGADLAALKTASLELQHWLHRYAGAHDVTDDLRPGKPEISVRLKEGAKSLGLDAQSVAGQLRTAFFGTTVNEIQVGPEAFEIDVRLAVTNRDSLSDLDNFTVATPDGDRVPITAVAKLEESRGFARINRVDGVRTVTIQGDVDVREANANEIISDTRARFLPDFLKRHPGISLAVEGQDKEAQTTQVSMIGGFLLGLVGLFLILSFQFRSYVEPVVVMIVIPFAFIGAVVGHIVMGLDFTMPSMLGFTALAGVLVNDSILLVNFIKDHHQSGATVAEAAPKAARARFRAIFLTSMTTILGLLPILLETSLQAQILIPLVTSLAFGLLISTVLVLFVVPAIYAILDDFGVSTLARESRATSLANPAPGR